MEKQGEELVQVKEEESLNLNNGVKMKRKRQAYENFRSGIDLQNCRYLFGIIIAFVPDFIPYFHVFSLHH